MSRPRAILLGCIALTLLAACTHGPSAESTTPESARLATRPDMAAVKSWALAIGDGALDGEPEAVATRWGHLGMVVIDGEEADPAQIAALQAGGTLVIGYLSVGTIEPWRSWYPRLEAYRLEQLEDWDEYYADVEASEYRGQIARIASEIMDKGFDGLFLDNVDMIEVHPEATQAMTALVSVLARLAHTHRGYLLAQNGAPVLGGMVDDLDGWNREDVTWTYDFDSETYVRVGADDHAEALAELTAMRESGLVTFATDYVADGDTAAVEESANAARAVGALPYESDIGLSRVPVP